MQSPSESSWIGASGEFFAAAVLQRHFKTIAFATSTSPYDLICESDAGIFYKCQVKATKSPCDINGSTYFQWNTVRARKVKYLSSDVDFFALVAVNERLMHFVLPRDVTSTIFRVRKDKINTVTESESLKRVMETVSE
jgi:hypothetical protein